MRGLTRGDDTEGGEEEKKEKKEKENCCDRGDWSKALQEVFADLKKALACLRAKKISTSSLKNSTDVSAPSACFSNYAEWQPFFCNYSIFFSNQASTKRCFGHYTAKEFHHFKSW